MNVKKMILSSMLITNALTIFIIEAQLPPIAPIPGIKLGLANVVTLFAIYLLGYKEAAKIHILRIVFLQGKPFHLCTVSAVVFVVCLL